MTASNPKSAHALMQPHLRQIRESRPETCEKHGAYHAHAFEGAASVQWTACPACVMEDARDRSLAAFRVLEDQRKKNRLLGSEIPSRYLHARIDGFDAGDERAAKAMRAAAAFMNAWRARAAGGGLIMSGNVGAGKTYLASAIGLSVVELGGSALYATIETLLHGIRAAYDRDAEDSEESAFARFTRPDLLILDEVGADALSVSEDRALFTVLDRRYSELRATILITNLTVEGLRAYLGPRIVDRMRDGGCKVIEFPWASRRGRVFSLA